MELHYPAFFPVFRSQEQHKGCFKLGSVFFGNRCSGQGSLENFLYFFLRSRHIHHIVQTMIRNQAAHAVEEFHSLLQGFFQICEGLDLHAGNFCQFPDIFLIAWFFQIHSLIWPPCRKNLYVKRLILFNYFMPFQVVYRIICSTQKGNIGLFDQVPHAHGIFLKLCITQIPYLFCCLAVENAGIAKKSLQLQMTPVEQRISDCLFQSLCPLLKFLSVRCIPGYIILFYSVRTHLTPFVMVAPQPYLGNILKFSVFGDFLRINMAMIIQYRNLCRKIVVQLFGCLCAQ